MRTITTLRSILRYSRAFSAKPKTGIVMLNMGGPSTVPEVGPFLHRLFTDGQIIGLGPFQNILGPLIAKRRTPAISKQYEEIGGSPIRKWTEIQGQEMVKLLDRMSPETAPHKFYIAFRYAPPLTEEAVLAMKADGVERAVAFSQYPQWSCTTAGSSMNHLWSELKRLGCENDFKWSLIDRWFSHKTFTQAVVKRIEIGLSQLAEEDREDAVIVFSAHSLPHKVVERGDQYVAEVAATVSNVMHALGHSNRYILAWQSKVGPLPWQGPNTGSVLKGLGEKGVKSVVMVPIAFTSDHIETLYEIDIEYREDAEKAGIKNFARAPSLNDEPLFIQAQAEIVSEHLASGQLHSRQYKMNCPMCANPDQCRSILSPVTPYERPSFK